METWLKDLVPVYAVESFAEEDARLAWRPDRPYRPPAGKRVLLGKFLTEQAADLELKNLPEHRALMVRLELVILCHWDGVWKEYGPDQWSASLADGPTLLATTFSNFGGAKQNFPDEIGSATHSFLSGSTSIGKYEFVREMDKAGERWGDLDTSYTIWMAVGHSAAEATLRLSGKFHDLPDGLHAVGESWAIAGCRVWAIPPDLLPDPLAVGSALTSLTNTFEVPSTEMTATLALAGDEGLDEMTRHLRRIGWRRLLPDVAGKSAEGHFQEVLGDLSNLDFRTREVASKQLLAMVSEHRKELLALRDSHPEPEVRLRIRKALVMHDELKPDREAQAIPDEAIIGARLRHVLRLMSEARAAEWLARLEAP